MHKNIESDATTGTENNRDGVVEIGKRVSKALRSLVDRVANAREKSDTNKAAGDAAQPANIQPAVETEPVSDTGARTAENSLQPTGAANERTPSQVDKPAVRPSARPSVRHKPEEPPQAAIARELEVDKICEGDVELVIAVTTDLAALAKLYNYLQSTPDMKILYIKGSLNRGTTIVLSLDKPLPLLGMLSRISGLKISPGVPQKNNPANSSGSLLGAKRQVATRVDLVLKAE